MKFQTATTRYLAILLFTVSIFVFLPPESASAQEKKWTFGLDLGGRSGLIDIKDGNNSIGFSTTNQSRPLYGLRAQRNLSEALSVTVIPSYTELSLSFTTGSIDRNTGSGVPVIDKGSTTDTEVSYLFVPMMATWKLGTKPKKAKGWELSAGMYAAFKINQTGSTFSIIDSRQTSRTGVREADFRFFDTGIHYEFRRFQPIFGIPFNFFVSTSIGLLNLDGSDGQNGLNNHSTNFGIGYRF